MLRRTRLIVRVAGVFLRRHVRLVRRDQPLVFEPPEHRPLHVVFRRALAARQALFDHRERLILDAVELVGGFAMRRNRGRVPHRFELLDQIA